MPLSSSSGSMKSSNTKKYRLCQNERHRSISRSVIPSAFVVLYTVACNGLVSDSLLSSSLSNRSFKNVSVRRRPINQKRGIDDIYTTIPLSADYYDDTHQELDDDNYINSNSSLLERYKPLLDAIQDANLVDENTHRFFHGRGGMFPGCEHVTMDLFPPVCLLTSHLNELQQDELDLIGNALEGRLSKLSKNYLDVVPDSPHSNTTGGLNWIYQHRPAKANHPAKTTPMMGQAPPDQHVVVENEMKFIIKLLHGQNHGLFLDMANGRHWVKRNSLDKTVLNLFAYTCGFSVAALLGGASQVINVDMAKGPLKIGQQNHELNGLKQDGRARFLPHDIFKSWGKLRKLGPYDMIIADPPSFQRKSFVATKDYAKLVRRFPDMLTPDGIVVLCLNAPELSTEWLCELVATEAPDLEYVKRISNPSTFPAKDSERSLKVLIYQKKTDH